MLKIIAAFKIEKFHLEKKYCLCNAFKQAHLALFIAFLLSGKRRQSRKQITDAMQMN